MISMAVELAERRLLDGSASAQEIVHYLKLGSSREKLEQERLRNENVLLEAKTKALESHARVEELFEKALDAMRSYKSSEPEVLGED